MAPEHTRRPLIVVAAEVEAEAIAARFGVSLDRLVPWEVCRLGSGSGSPDLLLTGLGEANAAGATVRAFDPDQHQVLVSAGIAGALPGPPEAGGIPIGSAVVASYSRPDVGVSTPDGFLDAWEIGFPLGDFSSQGLPASGDWLERARRSADTSGTVLTVSMCSGTDALASERAQRTGAIAEAMEGAAVGLVAHRLGAAFLELRVISNTTGDRDKQHWEIARALENLGVFCAAVLGPGREGR
ncbi:MAG: futalosine hydrolase [Planctomycetota bacterium]